MNEQEWNDVLSGGKEVSISDYYSREKAKTKDEEEMNEIIVKEMMHKKKEERLKKRERVLQMPRPTEEEREASALNEPMDKDEQRKNDNLFQESIEDIFESHLAGMSTNDMDYCDMQNVVNLIKNRQWKKIAWYVEKVNETYFRELIQTLLETTEEHLFYRMLKEEIAYKISLLDEWDEFHNLLEEPLRKVFKLIEDERIDKLNTYIDGVNFFRDEVEDHKRTARLRWKRILTHHPLNLTWLYNVKENEPWPQLPQVDRETSCRPNE